MVPEYRGPNGEKAQFRVRISEPYHTEYLLWLDATKLSDMMLLYGVRRNGDELEFVGKSRKRPKAHPEPRTTANVEEKEFVRW